MFVTWPWVDLGQGKSWCVVWGYIKEVAVVMNLGFVGGFVI